MLFGGENPQSRGRMMYKTIAKITTLTSAAVLSVAAIMSTGCDSRITRPRKPPTGAHLTVMTYNVNYAMLAPEETARTIVNADADIVCLQETTDAWRDYLIKKLEHKYPHSVFKPNPDGQGGGMGIMSKAPFREIIYTRPIAGWFRSLIIEADTALGTVQICNVHLRPSASDIGVLSVGTYLTAPIVHAREVAGAYEYMDPARPRLVVGDFNEDDFGGGIKWLTDKGFTNALPQFDTSTHTWRWPAGLITFRDRLDHIMHSSDLQATSARVIPNGQSDHLPVVAIIERAQHIASNRSDQHAGRLSIPSPDNANKPMSADSGVTSSSSP
jgi:endonuclease/exonuclease/phosphatase family metal-dependent hydrolase